jgi:hypothetical protein
VVINKLQGALLAVHTAQCCGCGYGSGPGPSGMWNVGVDVDVYRFGDLPSCVSKMVELAPWPCRQRTRMVQAGGEVFLT